VEPSEFVTRWTNLPRRPGLPPGELVTTPPGEAAAPLSTSSRRFLAEAGLPAHAAPCLRFDGFAEGLKPVYEVYGGPADSGEDERERLKPYLLLGHDVGGDAICVDIANQGRIVWLEHEGLRLLQFVNSSIPQLAECLLLYAEMIQAYEEEYGSDADLDDLPPALVQQTAERLRAVDRRAMDDGCFWHQVVQGRYP
jgi:hypothetical protein